MASGPSTNSLEIRTDTTLIQLLRVGKGVVVTYRVQVSSPEILERIERILSEELDGLSADSDGAKWRMSQSAARAGARVAEQEFLLR